MANGATQDARLNRISSLRKLLPVKFTLAFLVLLYIVFLHVVGLSLFTRGFLLTRLALPNKSVCFPETSHQSACSLPATHKRAVFLVIDALRYDFISPSPPQPSNPHFHNVLTLPAELSQKYPQNSFIFDAYSDPPTVTLQRIKGFMTGSLPTFVDIGSSFSASAISEDSIVGQLKSAGKRVAFAGDDTWLSVFKETLDKNQTWPFDSFNVEDLHSVDEGVIRHIFPLLEQADGEKTWDFFIGHFLGVDHVAHRLGPDHPGMHSKLKQMDSVLRSVVSLLSDDTLLIVLGDHGMDSKGDHGGDETLETSSALWIYSKSVPLASPTYLSLVPESHKESRIFPGAEKEFRAVQQIDLVPTLSLLLGLPIPFNNLGSVIPEVFARPSMKFIGRHSSLAPSLLGRAAQINSAQILSYLKAYRDSSPTAASELDTAWGTLSSAADEASLSNVGFPASQSVSETDRLIALIKFNRLALAECRRLWAQFDAPLMVTGLSVLVTSVPVLAVTYSALKSRRDDWEGVGHAVLILGYGGALIGVVLSTVVVLLGTAFEWTAGIGSINTVLASSSLLSAVALLSLNLRKSVVQWAAYLWKASRSRTLLPLLIMILHTVSFASNSFVMWEDRILTVFIFTLLLPQVIKSFSFPSTSMRNRVLAYGSVSAACIRLLSWSTVCREEQQPFCSVTFYASSTKPLAPTLVIVTIIPLSLLLPNIVRRFLASSKSDKGAAPFFIQVLWQVLLIGGTMYWLAEWVESRFGKEENESSAITSDWIAASLVGRTILARVALAGAAIGLHAFWWGVPLNIELFVTQPSTAVEKQTVTVIGFANTFGSMYLLFVLPTFGLLWVVTQLSGQVVLSLSFVSALCFVEMCDSMRDAEALQASFDVARLGNQFSAIVDNEGALAQQQSQSPSLLEPTFLILLGHLTFFATGHQATLSSIQWKTAFVGFPSLTYPFSPLLVSLNTFGPVFLFALLGPLLVCWAVSPVQRGKVFVLSDSLRLGVALMGYGGALCVGAAGSAALLRRHLMVWKVFAPRFMLSGLALLLVDAAVVFGICVGLGRTIQKVRKVFGTDV